MEVRNNFQSVSNRGVNIARRPAFGNYVAERQAQRAMEKQLSGIKKIFVALDKNNGENLNNIVTAVGTACVAPIFIRYNPLSDEDPKVKMYSAMRQPLSAVLALGVQLPAMKVFNNVMNKLAESGAVRRIDLSAKPPKDLLKSYAKAEYNNAIAKQRITGEDFLQGRTKAEFIEDVINQKRNELFYVKRDDLRKKAAAGEPISIQLIRDENGKIVDRYKPLKLEEIPKLQFVKPDELEKAKVKMFPEILKEFGVNPDDKSLYNVLMDYMQENPKEHYEKLKSAESVKPNEKEYIKSRVKSAIKNAGKKYKDFQKRLKEASEESAIKTAFEQMDEEANIKHETSQALNDMKMKLTAARNKIFKDTAIDASMKEMKIKEEEAKIVAQKVTELTEKLSKAKEAGDEIIVKMLNKAINKISGKSLDQIRYHGPTLDEVKRSVQVKKWLRAEINRREGVFSNCKKMSGLIYGLAILPFTCGLLNWAYPRFMEKFFPELTDAKKQAKAAKLEELSSKEAK